MRRPVLAFTLSSVFAVGMAHAGGEPLGTARPAEIEDEAEHDHLILDTGRVPAALAEPDVYRAFLHGEYQVRYQAERSFLLDATASAIAAHPGITEQSLGQNQFVHHWLRLTPELQLQDQFSLVAQADLTGVVFGQKAHDTSADATPRDAYNGFSNVQPRWLYAQYKAPLVTVRVGQQPNHWGMGILVNDGNHPLLFGDYRYGQIVERMLFSTRPGGRGFHVALAADLVYRDNFALLTRGDRAFQGVLLGYYEHALDRLGIYTAVRHQERDRSAAGTSSSYTDATDLVTLDLHGKLMRNLPGEADTFVFAEAEATYLVGETNADRTPAAALTGTTTDVRAYGGAALLGFVHRREAARPDDSPALSWGDLVASLEFGYASGDANPYDGTDRRFTFDQNHRIGLIMFDEVLRFQTARAATAAGDPLLANSARAIPGIDQLPSNGGVSGAQYINPTAVVRPRPWLDLKGGLVVAQATSDVVDPYRTAVTGSFVNYRGGAPKNKDLGIELDAGTEARIPLEYGLTAQIGAQGGVYFPGTALEDAAGVRMPVQWIAIGRLGVQF